VGEHETAPSANSSDATAMSARRNVRDIVESKRNGARMTGVGDAESARGTEAFSAEPATLYVVATPIGNLRDVTLRALDILRSADVILAEDTRVTATLLARYGIATRPRALHRHNEAREVERTRADIAAGRSVALVSDAGTPAISDPGARLVRAIAADGYRVVPLPGASAVAAAVSAAGLDAESFVFIGFLPQQAKARRAMLATFAPLPAGTRVLRSAAPGCRHAPRAWPGLEGPRMLTIARELTKAFETIARMPLAMRRCGLRPTRIARAASSC
jgi:16S rRNA (cytidine1402-2'-O)-methyltransferase